MKKKGKPSRMKKKGKPPGMTAKGVSSVFATLWAQIIYEMLKKKRFKGRRDDEAAKRTVALYEEVGAKCPLDWETLSDNLRNGRPKFSVPPAQVLVEVFGLKRKDPH
jgi:hypothetical protein